jgi:hypothetical protein
MEDTPGEAERPAEGRVREAVDLDAVSVLVVACPKDLAMFQDAVKTTGHEEALEVLDMADLVYDAIQPAPAEEKAEAEATV